MPIASQPHIADNPLAGVDTRALNAFATFGGIVRDRGELLVLIRPRDAEAEQMTFDSAVCRAGLKQFVRPPLGDEHDLDPKANYVKVCELAQGVRARIGITVCWPDRN
jgi:hypothetical protein